MSKLDKTISRILKHSRGVVLRIPRVNRVTHVKRLRRLNEERKIINIIEKQIVEYQGHEIR